MQALGEFFFLTKSTTFTFAIFGSSKHKCRIITKLILINI